MILPLHTDVRASNRKEKGGSPEDARQGVLIMNNMAKAIEFGKLGVTQWVEKNIAIGAVLPSGALHTIVVDVTPELAAAILERCNKGNRAIRKFRVEEFSTAMKEGRWKLSSQGMSISKCGLMNNGQHRLLGIVSSGETVRMLVTFGEERDVFDILDTGSNRSASDTLNIAGFRQTSNLAASARVLMMIERGAPSSNQSFTNDVVKDWVERHPDLQDFTASGTTIGKKLGTSQAGCTAAFYLIGTTSLYAKHMPTFVSLLSDGAGLEKRGPILTLREGLLRGDFVARVHAGIKGPIVAAAIVNAWNLALTKRKGSLPALAWKTSSSFPVAR